MILQEIRRAKVNTILCFVTVILATGLLVGMMTISKASVDATRILMRDMGFNLLITPAGVDPARHQALDFQDIDMPEENVAQLAKSIALAQHYVGKYQKTIQVNGSTVVLTGVLPEVPRHGSRRSPMPTAYVIPEGHVFLGSAAARALGAQPGDTVPILGRDFVVDRINEEAGTIPEDIRVFAHLHDVQTLLDRPGRINAIDALACFCPVETDDILAALESSVKNVLPEVNVQPYRSILLARAEQREMVQRLEMLAMVIVLAGSATAIWGLTYLNVRNRRREIGVLRALGVGDRKIAALFVGKILGYSVLGAAIGCAAGYLTAVRVPMSQGAATFSPTLAITLIVLTPATAILFGFPPILSGLLQETTDVLREEAP